MMSLIFDPKSDACLVPRHRRRDRYTGVGAAIWKPAIDTRTVPAIAKRLRLSKKVIAPVDFSATTPVSVYVAWSLARHAGGTLCLLHVVRRRPFVSDIEDVTWAKSVEEMSATALRHLNRIVERLHLSGVSLACLVQQGDPSAEICARATGADVIVIARKRHRFLERCLSALTADRIARNAHCSVLLLPVNATVPATTPASESPL